MPENQTSSSSPFIFTLLFSLTLILFLVFCLFKSCYIYKSAYNNLQPKDATTSSMHVVIFVTIFPVIIFLALAREDDVTILDYEKISQNVRLICC